MGDGSAGAGVTVNASVAGDTAMAAGRDSGTAGADKGEGTVRRDGEKGGGSAGRGREAAGAAGGAEGGGEGEEGKKGGEGEGEVGADADAPVAAVDPLRAATTFMLLVGGGWRVGSTGCCWQGCWGGS